MGSAHAEDARRPLLPRRNLSAVKESISQTAARPILTLAMGGRGGRELCSRLDLEKLLYFIIFLLAISFNIIAKLRF